MFQKIGSLGLDNPQLDEITASKSAGHHLSYCFVSKTIYLNSHIFCVICITVLIQPYRNLIFMQTREHFNWFPSQQTTGSCDSWTLFLLTIRQHRFLLIDWRGILNIPPLIKPLWLYEDGLSHSIKKLKKKPSSFLLDVPDAGSIKC